MKPRMEGQPVLLLARKAGAAAGQEEGRVRQMGNGSAAMDAAAWDRRYNDPAGSWGWAANIWVVAELAGLPPGAALDLGAGEGRHAVWLAGRGWQVDAVDFSAVGLAGGRLRAAAEGVGDRITWTVADASRFASAPESLDLVLVAYLQLPEDQLRSAVTSAAGALVPGGRFLLVNHDTANLTDGTGGPQDPALLQTPEQVAGWMRQAGLRVELAETRNRPVPGVRRPALDCVVLATAPGH